MMITAGTYGAPNWVDLATTDIEAATGFYREMFGWNIEKTTSPMGDYYIGMLGDRQVGGMMAVPEEMPPMWTVFIYVEDVDSTVDLVMKAGGMVLEAPFDIPEARIAVVADPTGGMFGIIAGQPPEGVWLSRDSGSVSWVELLTRDVSTAESFYGQVFGWKGETQAHGITAYTTFLLDGEPVAGMMTMPAELPSEVPAHWATYFTVTDCVEACQKATESGGSVLVPSEKIEMGHFAVLRDPQGATFHLMDYVT